MRYVLIEGLPRALGAGRKEGLSLTGQRRPQSQPEKASRTKEGHLPSQNSLCKGGRCVSRSSVAGGRGMTEEDEADQEGP
jgi:hypothetical protein